MPTAQAGLPTTQFGDVKFPSELTSLEGEGRHHVHEYPHTPGGSLEKLGRSVYRVQLRGNFQATFPGFPDLYPNGMNTLRGYFEQELTKTFTHPTAGQFPAMITKWHQVKDARLLSGEKVDIEIVEDQSSQFQLADLVTSADDTTIAASSAQLEANLSMAIAQLSIGATDMNRFTSLFALASSISAISDTATLYGNLYANNLQAICDLCASLESSASLQDARAWPVVDALLNVWQGAKLALQDLQAKRVNLATYIVPYTQAMVEIAIGIYDDASRQTDLLALNPSLTNAFSVPAGTPILYYPASA